MNKYSPEILSLRLDVEREVNKKIRTPYDFEFLVGVIWERSHQTISSTTLKRLWGYIDGADTTRNSTLDVLSKFLGYNDWDGYLAALKEREGIESSTFDGVGVRTEELSKGQKIDVTWLPNRRCVFRYDGDMQFTVESVANAKLHVGDTFSAACFLIGQPMFLDNLIHDGGEPVSYVAGSKSGLVGVKIID